MSWGGAYDPDTRTFTDKATFYAALGRFYSGQDGTRYRSSMSWVDKGCEDRETWAACAWDRG